MCALIIAHGAAIMKGVKLNMAKAQKLPSGNYRCRVTHTDENGIRHVESFTEKTAALAEAKAALWQAGMLERDEKIKHLPLGEAIDQYIDVCRATGISPSTIRSYVSYRKNAYGTLLKRPIDKLMLRDIQSWIVERSKTASPKTLKNNLVLISAVLKANQISMDFSLLKLPKAKKVEMEIPSDQQIITLLDDVYDDDDMYIAISLAALMGLRRSEICALRWADITVTEGTAYLSVDKALVLDEDGIHVDKAPKTQAGSRVLVIPDALYEELKRRRHLRPTLVSISLNAITERYMRLADRLHVPRRFHNLRHYHASVMLREGVPEKYIVADMGHASFDMVKRVYGHVMQEKKNVIHSAMALHALSILDRGHERCHASSES